MFTFKSGSPIVGKAKETVLKINQELTSYLTSYVLTG
jgi:hypothetical protein